MAEHVEIRGLMSLRAALLFAAEELGMTELSGAPDADHASVSFRSSGQAWELLRRAQGMFAVETDVPETDYAFGFLTSLVYEAVWHMEELPARDISHGVPDVTFTLFRGTVWFDENTDAPATWSPTARRSPCRNRPTSRRRPRLPPPGGQDPPTTSRAVPWPPRPARCWTPGMYAGVIGLVDVRGWSELALCIRTIVHDGRTYSTQSSAGIVAQSSPEAEWDETLAKMGAVYWALTGEELRNENSPGRRI